MTAHPNIVRLLGLVAPDGKSDNVEGTLLDYVDGVSLDRVRSATRAQKDKWELQLKDALTHLHEHTDPIFWGDAKPENIIVRKDTDDIVLFDFDGGHTSPWVSAA